MVKSDRLIDPFGLFLKSARFQRTLRVWSVWRLEDDWFVGDHVRWVIPRGGFFFTWWDPTSYKWSYNPYKCQKIMGNWSYRTIIPLAKWWESAVNKPFEIGIIIIKSGFQHSCPSTHWIWFSTLNTLFTSLESRLLVGEFHFVSGW